MTHWPYTPTEMNNKWTLALSALFLATACKDKEATDAGIKFDALSAQETGVDFSNDLDPNGPLNMIEYLYFNNGGGVAVGDLDGDGLDDLFFTGNQVPNKLYKNQGDFKFEDVTEKAGIIQSGDWSNGVVMADINNDGLLDIMVTQVSGYKNLTGHHLLYLNTGGMKFREASEEVGLALAGFGTQASFFDYDQDGDLDVYLMNHSVHTPYSYGTADKRNEIDPSAGDKLLENTWETGVLSFVDVTQKAGILSSALGYGLGLHTGDLNGDGWDDIYVGNDFHENDYLYLNNQDKTFRQAQGDYLAHSSRFTMGVDAADIDGDGRTDLMSLDMMPDDPEIFLKSGGEDADKVSQIKETFGFGPQYSRNHLQINQNNQGFADVALMTRTHATDWSWSVLLQDYNNDGNTDIFISNGILNRPNDLDYINYLSNVDFAAYNQDQQKEIAQKLIGEMPTLKISNVIFEHQGGLEFKRLTKEAGMEETYSNGAAYADLDRDGRLDLIVNNINQKASILRNVSPGSKHWVGLDLKSDRTTMGSRVSVYAEGGVWQKSQANARGFQSSSTPIVHFGLGDQAKIDSIVVEWVGRTPKVYKNLNADQYHLIEEKEGAIAKATQPQAIAMADLEVSLFNYQHAENTYFDYENEGLMPERLSIEGPAVVYEDFNSDGLKDLYIGGGKNQIPGYYLQQTDGSWKYQEVKAFISDAIHEDVDAAAIDFDKDGDLDLYVMSGGNDNPEGDIQMLDRLYLSNGKGDFIRFQAGLPNSNSGSISVADFNNDGYPDMYLGSRSIPKGYGLSPYSALLKNTQEFNFELIERKRLGMVTDSEFADLNADGWLDLIVVGDWMPVTVWMNQGDGTFKDETAALGLDKTDGFWNCITTTDLNGDGQLDLLVGNAGLNMKWEASEQKPISLFLDDYDENQQVDPIIFYWMKDRQVPFASKDKITGQLPPLKKTFTDYKSFTKAKDISGLTGKKEVLETKQVRELRSMAYLNQGASGFVGVPLPKIAQRSSIQDFAVDPESPGQIWYVGNYSGYVTELGINKAQAGGILSEFGEQGFKSHQNLPLPLFSEARKVVPLGQGRFLVVRNNQQAIMLNKKK